VSDVLSLRELIAAVVSARSDWGDEPDDIMHRGAAFDEAVGALIERLRALGLDEIDEWEMPDDETGRPTVSTPDLATFDG
jgi:hypothetical protein